MDDLDVWKGIFSCHVRVDIQLESPNVVHVLVVDLSLLHLIVKDAVLEGLEHLVSHIQVDVKLFDIGNEVLTNESALGLVDLLQNVRFQHSYQ